MSVLLILSVNFSVRIAVPLVTRSILEVVIPEHAVPKLVMKSKNKLAQISEVSLTSSVTHLRTLIF